MTLSWVSAIPTGPLTPTTSDPLSTLPFKERTTDIIAVNDKASQEFAAQVGELANRLEAAFDGTGLPVEVLEGEAKGSFVVATANDAPAGTVAVVRTSGSTGMPKRTALSGAALRANAAALSAGMHGDGHWVLSLPLHYVAGLTVVTRALLSRTSSGPARLAVMDLRRHFAAEDFRAVTQLLKAAVGPDDRLYSSLVPTQLGRLLDSEDGVRSLRRFDATLVGGGRTPDAIRDAAQSAHVLVRYTYGSAETCGGCVHNHVPLPGVSVDTIPGPDGGTRLRLGGDMVATEYLGDPERTAEHFVVENGQRFYVTDDLGEVSTSTDDTAWVEVFGRIDDVINTGGIKVSAQAVQRLIEGIEGVAAVLIIGVQDPEWGQKVGMGWEPTPAVGHSPGFMPDDVEAAIAAAVRKALGAPALPRAVRGDATLPRLGNGKPDRRTIAADLSQPTG